MAERTGAQGTPQGSSPQGSSPQGSSPQGSSPQGRSPRGRSPRGTPQGSSAWGSSAQGIQQGSSTRGSPAGGSAGAGSEGPAARTREERIARHLRNPKWKNPPLRIEMSECINCDACLRACPPQFGAIFNHGVDVVIVPELCSGCDKCVPVCPVDCIYEDPEWSPAPDDWWRHPGAPGDPYR